MVLRSECRRLSTVQNCHDGNESGRVDWIPGSKIGCDGHRKNPLLAENRRYAAMNFGHKVRDHECPSGLVIESSAGHDYEVRDQ